MQLEFNKNYRKWFAQDVLRAIKNYDLISENEKILLALSGGKDSTALLFIMAWLQKFSHLNFELSAIHIKAFSNYETRPLQQLCDALEIPYIEKQIDTSMDLPEKSVCSLCARLKRGVISSYCHDNGIKRVIYGHHANDVAETLLMNMLINKKLGSFCPKVGVPDSKLEIIRPGIYLQERTLAAIHKRFQLPLIKTGCPYEETSKRARFKEVLQQIKLSSELDSPELSMVKALENIDYTNIWDQVKAKK